MAKHAKGARRPLRTAPVRAPGEKLRVHTAAPDLHDLQDPGSSSLRIQRERKNPGTGGPEGGGPPRAFPTGAETLWLRSNPDPSPGKILAFLCPTFPRPSSITTPRNPSLVRALEDWSYADGRGEPVPIPGAGPDQYHCRLPMNGLGAHLSMPRGPSIRQGNPPVQKQPHDAARVFRSAATSQNA